MLSDDDDGSEEYNQASNWVRQQIHLRADPRDVLRHLFSEHTQIPEQVDDMTLWRVSRVEYKPNSTFRTRTKVQLFTRG